MLNLSVQKIISNINLKQYDSFNNVLKFRAKRAIAIWLMVFLIVGIIILVLPWTQNIQAKGKITTLNPAHRPQTVHATIPGRVEKWYVREGQRVSKGDTIIFLSEVKSEYLYSSFIITNNLIRKIIVQTIFK